VSECKPLGMGALRGSLPRLRDINEACTQQMAAADNMLKVGRCRLTLSNPR